MKRKNIFIIILSSVLLTATVSTAAVLANSDSSGIVFDSAGGIEKTVNQSAQQTKEIVDNNQNVAISYDKTEIHNPIRAVYDKYTDEDGNEYYYSNGEIAIVQYNTDNFETSSAARKVLISESRAEAIARNKVAEVAKDNYGSYVLFNINENSSDSSHYRFYFYYKIGDFLTDESVIVNVDRCGNIISYCCNSQNLFSRDFDVSKLNVLTEAEIDSFIEASDVDVSGKTEYRFLHYDRDQEKYFLWLTFFNPDNTQEPDGTQQTELKYYLP